jgi:hypothetical protein
MDFFIVLKNYWALWALYKVENIDKKKKLDKLEFEAKVKKLEKIHIEIEDSEKMLAEIDGDKRGYVTFQEFSDYIADFMVKTNYVERMFERGEKLKMFKPEEKIVRMPEPTEAEKLKLEIVELNEAIDNLTGEKEA